MAGGYIGLHRCLLDKPIWFNSTPEQKVILITLLLMANHKKSEWEWKGQKFKARPGQFVTSLESIVKKSGNGISIQNARSALVRFEKLEFLTNESTKTGRLVTIVNWELYQEYKNEINKDTNREVTKRSQRSNKEVTPNNNNNNNNNDNNNYIYSVNPELEQTILDFIEMRKKIKKPMTEKAIELMLNKLNKFSTDETIQTKILEQSIMNSWQGIFELKGGTQNRESYRNNNSNGRKAAEELYDFTQFGG